MLRQLLLIGIAMATLYTGLAHSAYSVSKSACSRVDSKMAEVQDELRAGYTTDRGEYLKDRLYKLKAQKKQCKKKRYATS